MIGIEKYELPENLDDVLEFEYATINLVSNETIFARVAELDEETFCALLPLKVVIIRNDGTSYPALVEYLLGSDDIFVLLPKRNCVTIATLSEKSIKEYDSAIQSLTTIIGEKKEEVKNEANIVSFPTTPTKH